MRAEWEAAGSSWPVLAGIEWHMLMQEHEAARRALPDDIWLELRYEDILADPAAAFEQMTLFAGLPPSESFDAALRRQTFSNARAASFRSELTPSDIATLDNLIGDLLRRHGYETA